MDDLTAEILRRVREANAEGRPICFTDLKGVVGRSGPTTQKRVRELLDTGELVGVSVQTPHGTERQLFVPHYAEHSDDTAVRGLLTMMVYQLRRIADAQEGKPPLKVKPSDGNVQLTLDESVEPLAPEEAPTVGPREVK